MASSVVQRSSAHSTKQGKAARDQTPTGLPADQCGRNPPQEWIEAVLEFHNEYRHKHWTPPLMWNEECFDHARLQADAISANGGRTLFYGWKDGLSGWHGQNLSGPFYRPHLNWGREAAKKVISRWYEEGKHYDFSNPNEMQAFIASKGGLTKEEEEEEEPADRAKTPEAERIVKESESPAAATPTSTGEAVAILGGAGEDDDEEEEELEAPPPAEEKKITLDEAPPPGVPANFAQIMWFGTTSVGMAISKCGKYCVANYFPAGAAHAIPPAQKYAANVQPERDGDRAPWQCRDPAPLPAPPNYWHLL